MRPLNTCQWTISRWKYSLLTTDFLLKPTAHSNSRAGWCLGSISEADFICVKSQIRGGFVRFLFLFHEEAVRAVHLLHCSFELRSAAVTQGTKSNTKYTLQDIWGQVFHSWYIKLSQFMLYMTYCGMWRHCIICMYHTQSMSLIPHRSPRVFTGIGNPVAAESCYISCSPQCVDFLLLQRCKYDK